MTAEDCLECVVSSSPVILRRQVRWGECDPAGIVHAAKFTDYALSAYTALMRTLAAQPGTAGARTPLGLPLRALSIDLRRALRPDETFEMVVHIVEVRTRTFSLQVRGRAPDGHDVFIARLTAIAIAEGERKGVELPALLRARLAEYASLNPRPDA